MPIDEGTAPEGTTPDASATPETAEVVVDTSADAGESYTIEDLLSADLSDYDEFATGDDGAQVNHTGMKPLNEVLANATPEVRKHLANMRAMITRKSQELADAKRTTQTAQDSVKADRDALLNGDFLKSLNELGAEPETPHDLFDEAGMSAKIKQEAARLMQEMMKPLAEERATATRQAQIDTFKTDHPDLVEPGMKVEVYKLLQSNENLSLENAYYIAKAKAVEDEAKATSLNARQDRHDRRSALGKTSTGSAASASGKPKFKSAWESYQWHKANPKT